MRTDRSDQKIGNYKLLRLFKEGGFAEVYLAEHIHLGTQAAIKVLHTQLTTDDVDRFRTEARTIARLIHPHIVRVFEFGVQDKTPFLIMDYAPYGTLRQRHPKGTQVPPPLIAAYIKQVASALQYAHEQRVIHRDIKPENMLLGRNNEVLLSDFGIALVAQSSRYQSTQDIAGTIAYMAPEQILGKPHSASDQYALGIIVYEWLTGDQPFHGSFTEIAAQHMLSTPTLLRSKVPGLSSAIEEVVQRALAKNPHDRFPSVQAFADALEWVSREWCEPVKKRITQEHKESEHKEHAFHPNDHTNNDIFQENDTLPVLTKYLVRHYVEKAFEYLPWLERNCLLLYADAEFTQADIAEILSLDKKAVQQHLKNASQHWLQAYTSLIEKEMGISLHTTKVTHHEALLRVKRLIQAQISDGNGLLSASEIAAS